jgi:hypothetical protein
MVKSSGIKFDLAQLVDFIVGDRNIRSGTAIPAAAVGPIMVVVVVVDDMTAIKAMQ